MSRQNRRNQAILKAVEVAARIDPSLFRAEYPDHYCHVSIKRKSWKHGQICTREKHHEGPHVTIDHDLITNTIALWDKPWFTTTKRSKSKRVK